MADMALCASNTCAVRLTCWRNRECPGGYEWGETFQPVAAWYPEAGKGCPGYTDQQTVDWLRQGKGRAR